MGIRGRGVWWVAACLAAAIWVGGGGAAWAQGALPDRSVTPGAINPAVTQDTIGNTICLPGWTRAVRPPEAFTHQLKRRQMREYGYAGRRLREFEEDHLVPLSLGGAPDDERNFWPEPREEANGWTADRKDELEVVLARMVCDRRLPLAQAQAEIAADWIAAWRRYVGPGDVGARNDE